MGKLTDSEQAAVAQQLIPVLKQMRAEFDQLTAKGLLAAFNLGQNSHAGLVLPPGASVTIGPFAEEK